MKQTTPSSNLNCCLRRPGSLWRELRSREPDLGMLVEGEE